MWIFKIAKGKALLLKILVVSMLVIGADAAMLIFAADPTAVAVVVNGTDSDQTLPPATKAKSIPIAWQITRSQFKSTGAATLSESFREVWSYEGHGDGTSYLVSPRARVAVIDSPTDAGTAHPGAAMARSIVIDELNFAKLLGVISTGADIDPNDVSKSKLISLNFSNPPKNGENLILHLSEDVHYEVHLEIGK